MKITRSNQKQNTYLRQQNWSFKRTFDSFVYTKQNDTVLHTLHLYEDGDFSIEGSHPTIQSVYSTGLLANLNFDEFKLLVEIFLDNHK